MILAGAMTVSACGELSPQEQARMDALTACAERATALFQILAVMQEPEPDEKGFVDGIDVRPNGDFTWSAAAKAKDRPLPDTLNCAGNLNERKIALVEFNGVRKRPSDQEVWKY
jgi:hypothetical protein